MARSRKTEPPGPSGFLVVDKTPGVTSHDVVDAARRALGTRRVGHLGTLDPQATGVLPLAVRDATRLAPFLAAGGKHYRGTIRLGIETDTLDADGRVTREHAGSLPDETALRDALAKFVGDIEQLPPMFSAVKIGGVALHRLARRGEEVVRAPRPVRIDRVTLLAYAPPLAEIEVECGPGTYVRALAADVGTLLGCGAHLASLRRLGSGPFTLTDAVSMADLEAARVNGPAALEARLVPPARALGIPVITLVPDGVRRILHGNEIAIPAGTPNVPRLAAVDPEGVLIAIVEARPGRMLGPVRVLIRETGRD